MLDSDTKRRIDTCRDILVGKVPDPKSQVEQITIALIYKFMDDMDAEAEALGGSRSFFTGDYAKYGWSKLMAPNMGGFDVLSLYSEAIGKMNENPGVPALFRDIFKNAYLPYRDPETLRSFLKEINGFTYDHSERLGDAFEYLLSVLGSQGEAGQFRTPRHIIDFMVEIIDPKKDDTILDPACGTAGFLISSYKHILKHNTKGYKEQQDWEAYDEKGVPLEALTLDSPLHYKGDLLTPDDKKRLAANIQGYDISPDMVRLSLVNMYLHGFTSPHIDEYDTLTSDEKWNELADVIIANPPFMSPKGGIKPHKRFSVAATRSEVLFVDYIAEHLTPNGRAAVVVPEGIIFQSGTAYKQLREMLVKNYLVAVISLPAGVFNPYSGVKTSILIMDKRLSKKTDAILFTKIDNDGFNLGAQRRPIDKNDLPAAARNVKAWLESVRSGAAIDVERISNLNIVAKEKIGEIGDYGLSGDRYQQDVAHTSHHEMVSLGDVTNLYQPKTITSKEILESGPYKVYGANGVIGYFTEYNHEDAEVLITCRGATCGTINMSEPKSWVTGNAMVVTPLDMRLSKSYLYYLLKNIDLTGVISGAAQPQITRQSLAPFKIPLPPMEVQKEIVAEIEGYQKIIDGARQVVENYQPRIPIHPDWPLVAIKEVARVDSGFGFPLDLQGAKNKPYPFLKVSDMNLPGNESRITTENNTVDANDLAQMKARTFPAGTVIFPKIGAAIATNKKRIITKESTFDNNVMGIMPNPERLVPEFLLALLWPFDLSRWASDAQPPSMRKTTVEEYQIPVPDIDTQRAIVAQIETDQRLVNANKELIRIFEDKIKATINRVWGEAE